MPEELNYHTAYKGEDVIKWVQRQLDATQKPGAAIPAWMVDAFEKAVDEVAPGDDKDLEKISQNIFDENNGSKQDDMFNLELVHVKAEDTTFTVVKSWLSVEGSAFSDMFSLPLSVEGATRQNPLVLEQTSASSFKSFLRVLYTGPQGSPLKTYDEWVGALELALRWNFDGVRKKSIRSLNALLLSLGPQARIALARRFSVGPWLRTGIIGLVMQLAGTQTLTSTALLEEKQFELDMETTAKVYCVCFQLAIAGRAGRICKRCIKNGWNRDPDCQNCTTAYPDETVENLVDNNFGEEIKACLYSEEL